MLEAHLASLWKPADERAFPSPAEKDRTYSIIDELQRELDSENSIIELTSKLLAEHQRRVRILGEEIQKRKLFIAPIRRVPDDVLVETFALALQGDRLQIWRFSHVCRQWRQLCLSHRWLWSYIEVDLAVDRPYVGLVPTWRRRAWGTKQTIVLQLYLEQFGALKGMLKGGLKYITHLRLTIPIAEIPPPKFDLPSALPCLRHLALINSEDNHPLNYFKAKAYITSLCHRLFTRRQTRQTNSVARFHLEFRNLAFDKRPRVMNCVQTMVLRGCTFTGPLQLLQSLEAARLTLKYLEYTTCWTESLEPLPHTRPLTVPLLLTLKHNSTEFTHQLPILSFLFCPALKTLTICGDEATLCTAAQFPAINELCLIEPTHKLASHAGYPLVWDCKQLETITIFNPARDVFILSTNVWYLIDQLKRVNTDVYPPSLRHIRIQYRRLRGAVEQFESGLREVADDFARRGRNIEFQLTWIELSVGK